MKIIAEVESSIYNLNAEERSDIRNKITGVLSNAKPPQQNITKGEQKAIKTLNQDKSVIILRADKGNSTVVMDSTEYEDKNTTQ